MLIYGGDGDDQGDGGDADRAAAHGSALTHLDLSANECGDHGAEALARALRSNYSLTTLRLEQSSVTAVGAEAFAATLGAQKTGRAKNVTLSALSLKCNPLGDEGGSALAQAMAAAQDKAADLGSAAGCVGLESLDLRDTGISPGACATIRADTDTAARSALRLLLED